MPKLAYIDKRFLASSLALIERANQVLEAYAAQGFTLTLRQLYYQFVARGWLPNLDREYKRLGSIVNDGRMAGLIDWDHIEDRGRWLRSVPHWDSPDSIIASAANSFRLDKWADQPTRLEVWIEKDALVGVIEGVCTDNDVPFLACRGYASSSAVWESALHRYRRYIKAGQQVVILYLGDHDPSGIDMTRYVEERCLLFLASHLGQGQATENFHVKRLALNMDQIEQYDPPPNPAKLTDTRSTRYIMEYGSDSWELDALDPTVIADLIEGAVQDRRDQALWGAAVQREERDRQLLSEVSEKWDQIVEGL